MNIFVFPTLSSITAGKSGCMYITLNYRLPALWSYATDRPLLADSSLSDFEIDECPGPHRLLTRWLTVFEFA